MERTIGFTPVNITRDAKEKLVEYCCKQKLPMGMVASFLIEEGIKLDLLDSEWIMKLDYEIIVDYPKTEIPGG